MGKNQLPYAQPSHAGAGSAAVTPAEISLAEAAAKAVIDGCENLPALRKERVAETARCQIVQDLLIRAMSAYLTTLPRYKRELFAHLVRRETFGIGGGCRQVAPVFGYLLDRIHGVKVTRIGHSNDHTMLVTKSRSGDPLYLDATWRQGTDKKGQHRPAATDPREKLPMVRVSEKKPTLRSLDLAVTEVLQQRTMLQKQGVTDECAWARSGLSCRLAGCPVSDPLCSLDRPGGIM